MHIGAISLKSLHDQRLNMCIIMFAKSKQATATKRIASNTLTWKALLRPLHLLVKSSLSVTVEEI
jgi:hypothetical protein